tara:strand:+ start:303 stop:473 length:171 start_codon:yes stop_codon:yes gene_type:complete
MDLEKVLQTIEEIKIKLKKQGFIQNERLVNHLENLNNIAFELKKREVKTCTLNKEK